MDRQSVEILTSSTSAAAGADITDSGWESVVTADSVDACDAQSDGTVPADFLRVRVDSLGDFLVRFFADLDPECLTDFECGSAIDLLRCRWCLEPDFLRDTVCESAWLFRCGLVCFLVSDL